ncbi:MAG: KR domain-containing protein [Kiritimatiellae bacterium]|nr:KR domain-containing protein [Kiritimatiellia bacterium]
MLRTFALVLLLYPVLAPKVSGAIHLDESTKNEPLDFVIFFSSTGGQLGNIG